MTYYQVIIVRAVIESQYIATECGVADMSGKSTTERAETLIGIAHPDFRDDLCRRAKALGYL